MGANTMKPGGHHENRRLGGIVIEGVPLGLANMSAAGLLILETAFIVVALVRGWLVVKIHYDAALKTAENYRAISEKKTETIHIQAQTIMEQGAVGKTVVKVMNTLQDASQETEDT